MQMLPVALEPQGLDSLISTVINLSICVVPSIVEFLIIFRFAIKH